MSSIVLARSIGLPYLLLSATSPLLMHWHALLHPGGRPYRLSAWSNAACALALLAFPFWWEPRFATSQLNRWWTLAFYVEAALLAASALWLYRARPSEPDPERRIATCWQIRLRWIAWPALASAFLLATSTHLCQVVAPAPLLWVVPLLVYLLSFVAVFERDWYRRTPGVVLALVGLLAMAAAMLYLDLRAALPAKVVLYAGGLLAVCLFCHGDLAILKPEPARLTSFWTHVAAGGALGSLFVGFVTPELFRGYFELPFLIAVTAGLCLWRFRRFGWIARRATAVAAVLAATPALAYVGGYYAGLVEAGRNFYGSLRVLDEPASGTRLAQRKMLHGLVTHGTQFLAPGWMDRPTTYYGTDSGAGRLLRQTGGPRHAGFIGLGAGTLAAYGRSGDRFRFYEINPLVVEMARRNFSFLARSAAAIEIVEGDARLRLAAEPAQGFDLLVVDAFSGDSIPVHLLTREAMALYLGHLRPGGAVAFHVSNQYLDLEPVVAALAADAGQAAATVFSPAIRRQSVLAAEWVVVASPATLESAGLPVNRPRRLCLWTDDHNSLLQVLQ